MKKIKKKKIITIAILSIIIVYLLFGIYRIKRWKADKWIVTYIKRELAEKEDVDDNKDRHIIFTFVDHYEPGYKESMGWKPGTFSFIQEKECFASLMTGFDKKKLKKYPEFNTLQRALDKKLIDEYIYYEILLTDYPFAAYQLPEETIEKIKQYVIEIRGKKK